MDIKMISLKHLLILMGSVSLLMMIAVAVVKVQNPSYVTLGEVRAIDRICHRFADDMMARIASNATKNDETILHQLHECMGECRAYLIGSRTKSTQTDAGGMTPREVPACFGEKLTDKLMRRDQDTKDSSKSVRLPSGQTPSAQPVERRHKTQED